MTAPARPSMRAMRSIAYPGVAALTRTLWRPRLLSPWPAWSFGSADGGLAGALRKAVVGTHRAIASQRAPTVPWHHGLRVSLDLSTDFGKSVFLSGAYEPNEMSFVDGLLRTGMTAVDVGANVGWYTMLMAAVVGPTGTVVAFEPSARERVTLLANLDHNGLGWVRVDGRAVFDRDGTLTLRVADDEHRGHNTVGAFAYLGVGEACRSSVGAVRLDALDLERLDLLKVDVEGAELRVLQGAERTLERCRPVVLFEAQEVSLRGVGDSVADVLDFLAGHRYLVGSFDEGSGRPALPSRDERPAEPPPSSNLVAVPAEHADRLAAAGLLTTAGSVSDPH